MKYNLIYAYNTASYIVYTVTSRDPNKNGRKVYIPKDIDYDNPLIETDIIFSEPTPKKDGRKRTKPVYRNDDPCLF